MNRRFPGESGKQSMDESEESKEWVEWKIQFRAKTSSLQMQMTLEKLNQR